MPQQRKKKERSETLRGERDQIKFIDLGFERWQRKMKDSVHCCRPGQFSLVKLSAIICQQL